MPTVPADSREKTGCLHCPLLPFSTDFGAFKEKYTRKYRGLKEREPDHVVRNRLVEEPPTEVDVLMVGEGPGGQEDYQGVPFVGKAGQTLRRCIKLTDSLQGVRIGYENLVRCRPPRNRAPNKTEVHACLPRLIQAVEKRKPKVLVALGGSALNGLTGLTGVTALTGQIVRSSVFPDLRVVVAFHPSYVNRAMGFRGPADIERPLWDDDRDSVLSQFRAAMEIVAKYLSGDVEERQGVGEYFTLDDLAVIEELLDGYIEEGLPVAVDTETGVLVPQMAEVQRVPQLLSVHVTNEEGYGFTIPFEHSDAPWNSREMTRLKRILCRFFESDVPKVGQNFCKFDRQHIFYALGVYPANTIADTMLTHMVVDERPGTHGLKTLAYICTGMGGYEKPMDRYVSKHKDADPAKGGSYANVPGKILFQYGAMDADCTLRVYNWLLEHGEYQSEKLRTLAETFLPRLGETLADLELAGARVDRDMLEHLSVESIKQMRDVQRKIRQLPTVRKFVAAQVKAGKQGTKRGERFSYNPGSYAQTRQIMFRPEYYGLEPEELTEKGFEVLRNRYSVAKQLAGFAKFTDIVQQAKDKMELDFFTLKKDVLHEYERQGNELAPLVLAFTEQTKFHGTFIEPIRDYLDLEDLVHGNFWPWGTATGRLSSSKPNLQNIPYRARQAYTSRFEDGVLISADYSQIELRVAACWYDEPEMVKAYRNNEDLHTLTAVALSNLTPEAYAALSKDEQRRWRLMAKRINFGCLYGAGPKALQVALAKEGVFVDRDECRALLEDYFDVRPGLAAGIRREEAQVRETGYLESFTGRRRRLPDVFSEDEDIVQRALRQSINFPIQSGASDITAMSLVKVNRELRERGYNAIVVLTVHDSIIADAPIDEVPEVSGLLKQYMESVPAWSDEVLPGLDWKWLRVSLKADFEAGYNWGQQVEFDPEDLNSKPRKKSGPLFKVVDGARQVQRPPVTLAELQACMKAKLNS